LHEMLTTQCGTMVHRGPDASGEWRSADGRVALGHRRLAIIDLSEGGSQPMEAGQGTIQIVLNGSVTGSVRRATPKCCSRRTVSGASIAFGI